MPNTQRHRGAHPDDPRLFSEPEVQKLRVAIEEAAWLLGRGYADSSVVDVVGRHHQLEARQRMALARAMCSPHQAQSRAARATSIQDLAGQALLVDGFNLIITLEVALSHGVLFQCADGTLRDIAGLRGSYHTVEETERALDLLASAFSALQIASAKFYLDAPISNSGRLRQKILEHASAFAAPLEVELVRDPDQCLRGGAFVVSSDSVVIDNAQSWFNMAAHIVREQVRDAWIADLSVGVGESSKPPTRSVPDRS